MVSSSKMVVKVLLLISAVCGVMASAIAGDIVGNNNNNNNDVQAAEMARYNAQLQFNSFTRTYNKRYDTVEETLKRFEIFQKNVEWINKKNAEQSSFTVAVNQFADMTQDEVRSHLTGAINFGGNMSRPLSASHAIPTDLDWRAKGAVTPVQNEGPCGSTWAFSPISAIESANFIKTNKLVQLSVGQQMDCGSEFGSQGCNGGYPDGVYKFGVKYGICTDADYPYNPSSQGVCKRTCKPAVWLSGYVSLKASETDLLTSVASVPVNVNMDASCQSFTYYQSGVLDDPSCSRLVNHCITAVGYGTDSASGKDYWIFKNMWGAQWGDQGYIKLVRGKNQCGIVTSADFPNGYPVVA